MQYKTFYSILLIALVALLAIGAYFFFFQNKTPVVTTPSIDTTTALEEIKIVAFGDSLTAGYGIDLQDSYPSILERELQSRNIPVEVINMGVSGETTSGGKDRVSFVIAQKPAYILLGLGANDMLRASPVALAKSNLEYMIQEFQKENIPVVLLGMQASLNSGSIYRKEFNAMYEDLSKKYSLPLVPFFLEGVVLRQALNISDGIHPNKDGYEKIVKENILPVVLPLFK